MVKSSVERLIRNGIIKESERELYYFGVNGLCLFLVNIATSVIIGILFGMLWQSLLFSAAYIPLRSYAGGYHAKTPGMCYILSTILIACVLMVWFTYDNVLVYHKRKCPECGIIILL